MMIENDVKDPVSTPVEAPQSVVVKEVVALAPVSTEKKVVTKKATAKKAAAKNAAAKKAPAKKAVAKKAVTQEAVAKKPSVKKAPAKKAPAKKAAAKKDAAVKAIAKKPSAKKLSSKKTTVQKTTSKRPKVVPVEVAPAPKAKKVKLIRDSFTMPGHEYQVLQDIKKAALKAGIELKKSDLLRIGVGMLKNFSVTQLDKARAALTKLSAGRPKK
jgi:hypothetical protein